MSRREAAYCLATGGSVVILVAVIGLWIGNPGLTRGQLIITDGVLVVLAAMFVAVAIVAHLRGDSR